MPRSKICCQCLRTGALHTYNHAIQQGFIIGYQSDGYFTRQCSRGNGKSMTRMLTSDFNMQSLLREKNEIAKLFCSTDGNMLVIMCHGPPTGVLVLLCTERHTYCGTHNQRRDVSCFMHNNNISSVVLPVIAHADGFIVPVNTVLFTGRGIPHLSSRVLQYNEVSPLPVNAIGMKSKQARSVSVV